MTTSPRRERTAGGAPPPVAPPLLRSLLGLALLGATTGCYGYVDRPLDAVPPGTDLRVEVTAETARRLTDALAQDQRSVEGTVRSSQDGSVLLEVVTTTRQVGFSFEPLRQTIRLEPRDVTRVQQRTLDRSQTTIAMGLLGAAVGAIAWKALGGKSGGDTKVGDPNQPADARVVRPFFTIPLNLPWSP